MGNLMELDLSIEFITVIWWIQRLGVLFPQNVHVEILISSIPKHKLT